MPQNIQTERYQRTTCKLCGYDNVTFISGIGGYATYFCPFEKNEWHQKSRRTAEDWTRIKQLIIDKERLADNPAQAQIFRLALAEEIKILEAELASVLQRYQAEILEAHRLAGRAIEIRETAKKRLLELKEALELLKLFREVLELNLTFVPTDQMPKVLYDLINWCGGKPTRRQITEEIDKLWAEHQTLVREH